MIEETATLNQENEQQIQKMIFVQNLLHDSEIAGYGWATSSNSILFHLYDALGEEKLQFYYERHRISALIALFNDLVLEKQGDVPQAINVLREYSNLVSEESCSSDEFLRDKLNPSNSDEELNNLTKNESEISTVHESSDLSPPSPERHEESEKNGVLPLLLKLDPYSTPQEIAASDLFELEQELKKNPYRRSTDYQFCAFPEKINLDDERIYNSGKHQLKSNKIYIQLEEYLNEDGQSERVVKYFVRSRAGGLLEGTLTAAQIRRHMIANGKTVEVDEEVDDLFYWISLKTFPSAVATILNRDTTLYVNLIYEQLEEESHRIIHTKRDSDDLEERGEYFEKYENQNRHVGIFRQTAAERNQIIQEGFEYVFYKVMLPIAEERARLYLELIRTREASRQKLETYKTRQAEITQDPSKSYWTLWMGMSTEQEYLSLKITELEKPMAILEKKIDYLTGVLESLSGAMKRGRESYDTPFSGINSAIGRMSHPWPDSSYRQKRRILFDNPSKNSMSVDVLQQARDGVKDFMRKLAGVVLIPLRAILGSCAPECLQKQAFYHTQSAHRLFQTKQQWDKYNTRAERDFDLPLSDLAVCDNLPQLRG